MVGMTQAFVLTFYSISYFDQYSLPISVNVVMSPDVHGFQVAINGRFSVSPEGPVEYEGQRLTAFFHGSPTDEELLSVRSNAWPQM
jgi:hypothetical protein